MILLDSNIVIYLRNPVLGEKVANQLQGTRLNTCNIIVTEVLGYKAIEKADFLYFEDLFSAMKNHPFDDAVTSKAIELRRRINIGLPDAIIAATTLINNLTLWTHNVEDFAGVPNIRLFDPISV